MKFGELLASLRRERGILQKELAAYLNVTVATISNYEKGVHAPDYETLVKLADFFDVSTDYLLQRTEYKSSIQTLNQKLVVNYTVSELVNAILQLDQNSMTALIDYYELLSLRNSMNAVKQGK
ncbi:MAG: helix-turn-helix domain-containing protein [Lachnospiraceae bacterium]|jgi:transcriptional regulator with XRE-family HTH domain|nr:helix-turn-helix transcriptional regulator [Lachnospiraceae bacterium]MDE6902102.1 helix-turn-helix domain-containing protein [Lachnospiraceae bacterium]MDE6993866.1 helix-turn-helix domain-containing protein [Lachnospiraceae bacterium]